MMNTPLIHPSIRLGLGLSAFLILGLGSACTAEGDHSEFRGDEHETTGTDTGGDTGMTDSGGDTHGKDVGDDGGDDGGEGPCPRTQGYWKNWNVYAAQEHRQIAWPISEDTVMCEMTWYEWLQTPPAGGDAWIILAHQFIAASLNDAAGVDVPDDVADALASAAAYLDDCAISAEDREAALATSELLDAFNNGQFSESCDDDDDDHDDDHDDDGDDDGDDGDDHDDDKDDDHDDDEPCDDDDDDGDDDDDHDDKD